MSFVDKLKGVAQDVATEARKATVQAQTKVEEQLLKRKLNEHAQALGWLWYRERTQGVPAGAEADRLVGEMSGLETQLSGSTQPARAGDTPSQADPGAVGQASPVEPD